MSIRFGAKGPNLATCTACAASAHAIGDACEVIRRGDADVMIAGGSEAAITPMGVGGFAAMRALSTRNDAPERASRPFDSTATGSSSARGRASWCSRNSGSRWLAAPGSTPRSSATGRRPTRSTSPRRREDGDGAVRAMQAALRGVDPSEVDYINAHGTSTPHNDRIETIAIKQCFGEHARRVAISSTKSMTGHLLGAAGGLEGGITALALHHQVVPPTINLENPDPACDLDYVPNASRAVAIRYAMSNSFGFGGTNAALLLKRFEG